MNLFLAFLVFCFLLGNRKGTRPGRIIFALSLLLTAAYFFLNLL